MDQIKSFITPSKFKVWVRHVESHTRNKRLKDDVIGTSYLKGVWDKKAHAYRATKYHIHPEFRYMGFQIDLFRAALELMSSAHKKLISDDVITSNQRKHIDEVIQQGHIRKDLPFGKYLLDSPRRANMARTSRSHEVTHDFSSKKKKEKEELSRYSIDRNGNPPNINRRTEGFIWSIGDALTRALREPQGDRVGDNRFWVSGLSTRTWSILHPDLEMLEYGESPLILRIKKVGNNKWDVEGQNQLQNLKNKVVLKTETTPPVPNKTWEIDYIAAVAAKYFLKEKDKIMELKQAMQPQQAPGSSAAGPPPEGGEGGGMPGMGGGMPGMGMAASRRAKATLTNLHRAQDIVTGLNQRYGSQRWFRDARVLNDRFGIGIAVRLRSLPEKRLKASLSGIPVYWQHANKRIAAGEPKESPEMSYKDLVNLIHSYLLPPRRSFKSPANLARRLKKEFSLKIELDKLVMMIGKLMSSKKLNFSNGRFKAIAPPVEPKDDLVAVRTSESLYRLDKGNWRTEDQLRTTVNSEIFTKDAPEEEEQNEYSRIMPDPTSPN